MGSSAPVAPVREIYLDHNATTPVDPRVIDVIMHTMRTEYGNPNSLAYLAGARARDLVEGARGEVAALLAARPAEITFCSGATEACNWFARGVADMSASPMRAIVSPLEHHAVLAPLHAEAAASRLQVELCRVDDAGRVDLDDLESRLRGSPAVLALQAANNEIHSIQPLSEVGQLVRRAGAIWFCDATQMVGRVPFDPRALGIDILATSFHKVHGPKGVGALWLRRGSPAESLPPLQRGGGQEHNRRSGTENVPLVAGAGEAARLARLELIDGRGPARARMLRDRLEVAVRQACPAFEKLGHATERLPHGLAGIAPGVDLLAWMSGPVRLAFSQMASCSSTNATHSHVLTALGRAAAAANFFRMAVGRFTTDEDIDVATEIISTRARMVGGAYCVPEHPTRDR